MAAEQGVFEPSKDASGACAPDAVEELSTIRLYTHGVAPIQPTPKCARPLQISGPGLRGGAAGTQPTLGNVTNRRLAGSGAPADVRPSLR